MIKIVETTWLLGMQSLRPYQTELPGTRREWKRNSKTQIRVQVHKSCDAVRLIQDDPDESTVLL